MNFYGYMDKSGDPSRKEPIRKPFFTVDCLLIEDYAQLPEMMHDFRWRRGWSPYREITFSDSDAKTRREFLSKLARLDVRISVLVVDKRTIQTPYIHYRRIALQSPQAHRDVTTVRWRRSVVVSRRHAMARDMSPFREEPGTDMGHRVSELP